MIQTSYVMISTHVSLCLSIHPFIYSYIHPYNHLSILYSPIVLFTIYLNFFIQSKILTIVYNSVNFMHRLTSSCLFVTYRLMFSTGILCLRYRQQAYDKISGHLGNSIIFSQLLFLKFTSKLHL